MADNPYIATDPVAIMALNNAVADMGRLKSISALLFDGPPGTGKSFLAEYVARLLEARFIRFQIFEGCDRGDLILERGILDRAGRPTKGVLLEAIESSLQQATVLLLDEIDKAHPSFDGLLLNFLNDSEIYVPQLGKVFRANNGQLLILITKNDQRDVARALMDRCRVTYMAWPSMDTETTILQSYWPFLTTEGAKALLGIPHRLRIDPSIRKKPSTRIMVRLVSDMMEVIAQTDDLNIGRYYIAQITTIPQDQEAVTKMYNPLALGRELREALSPLLEKYTPKEGRTRIPVPNSIRHGPTRKERAISSPVA